MVAASAAGLLVGDLYPDGPWAREALRGGDLTTITVAVPVLVVSLLLSRRGSRAAQAVWLGALAYSVYNYAYYVFGAEFNDVFVLHIALFSLSIGALVLAVANVDVDAIATRFRDVPGARIVGGFLTVVGSFLGLLWVSMSIRYAVTGELMAGLPADGVHLVFAIDTSLLVPALVIAGILLWRRTAPRLRVRNGDGRDGRDVPGEPPDGRAVPGERGCARCEGLPAGGHPPHAGVRAGGDLDARAGRGRPGTGGAARVTTVASLAAAVGRCPRQDSNLRFRLRRAALYPLSYGGGVLAV